MAEPLTQEQVAERIRLDFHDFGRDVARNNAKRYARPPFGTANMGEEVISRSLIFKIIKNEEEIQEYIMMIMNEDEEIPIENPIINQVANPLNNEQNFWRSHKFTLKRIMSIMLLGVFIGLFIFNHEEIISKFMSIFNDYFGHGTQLVSQNFNAGNGFGFFDHLKDIFGFAYNYFGCGFYIRHIDFGFKLGNWNY